jgi:hypothetical protein
MIPPTPWRSRLESLSAYGFAHPTSGRAACLFRPKANAEFARWADPTGEMVLAVIVDDSGGHTAKK